MRDPSRPSLRQTRMKIVRAALVVPAIVLVAACGASATSTLSKPGATLADSAGRAAESVPVAAPDAPGMDLTTTGSAASGYADTGKTAGAKAESGDPLAPAVISKGQVSLHTKDIDDARFELQKLLSTWGGSIANEESTADDHGHTRQQHLVIRVPSAKFGTAMDAISGLGVLVDRSRTAEDVTTQVIDTNARVRSQKLSLARIQALLAKANDLNQIIAIESQLSQRQADLDSLEQQQKYLADQTSQATIDVFLSVPDKSHAGKKDHHDGFFGGLKAGWENLGTATSAVLKTVGAVLPFGAALLVLAVPFWLVRRRRAA